MAYHGLVPEQKISPDNDQARRLRSLPKNNGHAKEREREKELPIVLVCLTFRCKMEVQNEIVCKGLIRLGDRSLIRFSYTVSGNKTNFETLEG